MNIPIETSKPEKYKNISHLSDLLPVSQLYLSIIMPNNSRTGTQVLLVFSISYASVTDQIISIYRRIE